jgi:hypothetical protein
MTEVREYPPPILNTYMVGAMEDDVGDPGAPTTYPEDMDGRLPRRQC